MFCLVDLLQSLMALIELLLLMAEILHQLMGSLSHYLQGFIHPWWCRISAINSIIYHLSCVMVTQGSCLDDKSLKKMALWLAKKDLFSDHLSFVMYSDQRRACFFSNIIPLPLIAVTQNHQTTPCGATKNTPCKKEKWAG